MSENSLPLELKKFERVINFAIPLKLQNSFWVSLNSPSGSVEGKLHLSQNNNKKLLIYEPGYPGDGSTRLEHLWLEKLLQKGFSVVAVRHSGTIINGKHSNTYLNCPERQSRAMEDGQETLGNKQTYTIADWLKEPLIVLESLS